MDRRNGLFDWRECWSSFGVGTARWFEPLYELDPGKTASPYEGGASSGCRLKLYVELGPASADLVLRWMPRDESSESLREDLEEDCRGSGPFIGDLPSLYSLLGVDLDEVCPISGSGSFGEVRRR